jgi:acyl-CoA thioesterase FadM
MEFFHVRKKVHWSDTDAAGVVWFPNFLGWFEDAEEEVYQAALGQSRQALLDAHRFGMPRVEASIKFRSPARAGQIVRIGIASTLENPRRLRHDFAILDHEAGTPLADGFVRVACVDLSAFTPRDLPGEVLQMVARLPALAARQKRDDTDLPWT